jgi:hypothetical protein
MNDEYPQKPGVRCDNVENELRRTADELSRWCDRSPPVRELLAEHFRRRRQRFVRFSGAICLLLVISICYLVSFWPFSKETAPVPSRPEFAATTSDEVKLPNGATRIAGPASNADIPNARNAPTLPEMPAPILFPVVVASEGSGGQPFVTTAIYIPEHSVTVDLRDLSPAEQRAVQRILDNGDAPDTRSL